MKHLIFNDETLHNIRTLPNFATRKLKCARNINKQRLMVRNICAYLWPQVELKEVNKRPSAPNHVHTADFYFFFVYDFELIIK